MDTAETAIEWTPSKIFLMCYGIFTFSFYTLQYMFAYKNHQSCVSNVSQECAPDSSDETMESGWLRRGIHYCYCHCCGDRHVHEGRKVLDCKRSDSMDVNDESKSYGALSSDDNDTLEVCAVGYKESPELFRRCLESIRDVDYNSELRITIVVDGNSDPDELEMVDVAKEIFGLVYV